MEFCGLFYRAPRSNQNLMAGGITRHDRRAIEQESKRNIAIDRSIDVYSADTSQGWRIIRKVTAIYAFEKVVAGYWKEIFDHIGNFIGVQILAVVKSDEEIPSGATAATITFIEIIRNAGLEGRSRTIGRDENFRITRENPKDGKPLPPEDNIERAIAKVKQWPFPASRIDNGRGKPVFGDRAIRCYPHSS